MQKTQDFITHLPLPRIKHCLYHGDSPRDTRKRGAYHKVVIVCGTPSLFGVVLVKIRPMLVNFPNIPGGGFFRMFVGLDGPPHPVVKPAPDKNRKQIGMLP